MLTAYFFLFIVAAILLGFAVEALIKGTYILNVASALFFVVLALVIGGYGLKEYLIRFQYPQFALMVSRLDLVAILLLSPSAYFVSMYFPRGKVSNRNRSSVFFAFLIALVLAVFALLGWNVSHVSYQAIYRNGIRQVFGIVQNWNLIFYLSSFYSFVLLVAAVVFVFLKYRKVDLIYQKKQIRYFIFGVILSLIELAFLLILKSWIPPVLQVFGFGISALTLGGGLFYSIVRYRFVNMRDVVQRHLFEFLLGVVLLSPIVILLFGLRIWLDRLSLVYYGMLMVAGLYFLFRVYQSALSFAKRLIGFDKSKEDITGSIMTEIGTSRHLDGISRNTAGWILDHLNCRNVEILVYQKETESYVLEYSALSRQDFVSALDPIFSYLSEEVVLYDREQIGLDPRFSEIRPFAERYFAKHECQLLMPLYDESMPILLIHIDSKIDGQSYDRKEIDHLFKLSRVLKILIQNLILFAREQESRLTVRDLNIASHIQESLYQKDLPVFANLDVFAYQKPAKWVNGDYYHVSKVAEDEMAVVIADVSGKGVPAALVGMMIHSVVKSQEFEATSTNAIVSKMNDVMASNQSSGSMTGFITFATVFCGFLDHRQRTLYYTNAGHFPLIIYDRKKDDFKFLKSHARPVGIFADVDYPTLSYEYNENQVMVLYTDGITEATNHEEEEFGEERLNELIRKHSELSSSEITDAILNELSVFTAGLDQFDDITLIVIKT